MPFNLFLDPLEGVSFETLLIALESLQTESQRLDFKESLDGKGERDLAKDACGFANAYGGVFVIGIRDPKKTRGAGLEFVEPPPTIGDVREQTLASRLLALTYPSVPVEVKSFREDSTRGRRMIVIRIGQSPAAPHEFVPEHKFVVRHGTSNSPMSLPELEAMIRRRDATVSLPTEERPQEYPLVQLGPVVDSVGRHVGVSIKPTLIARRYDQFGRDDEAVVRDSVSRLRDFKLQTFPLEEGMVVGEKESRDKLDCATSKFACEIQSDRLTMRLTVGAIGQLDKDVQYVAFAMSAACSLAARLYARWHYSPTAQMRVVVAGKSESSVLISMLPKMYDRTFLVNLSSNPLFAELERPLERVWRAGGSNPRREAVGSILSELWEELMSSIPFAPWYWPM